MHHTKVKADIGLCKVITDLTVKGYTPCVPLSEHQAFDLVAVSPSGTSVRMQVKYATLRNNGSIEIRYRRNWSDSNGCHSSAYKDEEFDYYAIYCPEKDIVLYIPHSVKCPKTIRFDKPANNQVQYIKWARDYLEIHL